MVGTLVKRSRSGCLSAAVAPKTFHNMMKSVFVCLFLITQSFVFCGEQDKDPFSRLDPKPVDRSKDLKSDSFISNGLLAAFREKRLDKGSGNKKSLIRITIRRSFHSTLMFQWFPGESRLQVKRLKPHDDPFGDSWGELDLDRSVKLPEAQQKLLKILYSNAPLEIMPQDFWQPQGLDGSTWIYESAAEGGSILVARRNPVDPSVVCIADTGIKPGRLSKELQLTSFALMLRTLSGIDEEPY
ncbi:hypothetical protein NT6N_03960 [Oceaniferula spumae]|uniref:Uncharacterized protein n=2 Tax=Oceaniferula spumae TaxID=2979115 RepID=A0AAT9FH95_9BACT